MGLQVGLPIGGLINITLNLAAQPLPVQNFSAMLILGPSTVIDVVQRYREYSSFTEVANDFPSNTPEYAAAQAWFDQNPTPQLLYIGRWIETASAGQLIGGAVSSANQVISTWAAISNGSFTVKINGTSENITGLNFSAPPVTSMNGVATVIGAALNASVSGTTCVWNAVYNRFVITSPTTGIGSSISFVSPEGTGIDISAMMGGTAILGAYEANGMAAETALACVSYFDINYPTLWFGLYLCGGLATDYEAIQGYIEATSGRHFQGIPTQDPNCLNPNDTTNIAYLLQQLKYNFCIVQYSSTSLYAVVSLLARILTTNWSGSATAIDIMYKQEPGIVAEYLTTPQSAALQGFNCNVYVNYNIGGSTPIIQWGNVPSGNYIDAVIGAAVLAATIQTNLFNINYTTPTKIAQTDSGQGQLESGIIAACKEFVTNGYLAPGVWTGQTFGAIQNGQFLPLGWAIYQPPVSSQSPATRGARMSVPFQIAATTAGATNQASVAINLV